MSKNIICEQNHQKCFIPSKISTKLKMLTTISAITMAAVVTFSGCASERQNLQQTEAKDYAQAMEETTGNEYNTKEEIEQGIEYDSKEQDEETKEQDEETKEQDEETIGQDQEIKEQDEETIGQDQEIKEQDEETIGQDQEIEEQDKQIVEYSQLLTNLNQELNKKNFSYEANQLLIDTFDRIYNNYSSWENGYNDMPSKEEYIQKNYINIIKDIDEVNFYDSESEQAKKLIEEGSAAAWTEYTGESLKISIIAKNKNEATYEERNQDIEFFYHEVAHCKQENILLDWNYFNNYESIKQIFIEGGATFHMKFTNPFTEQVWGAWSIANEKGDLIIDYNKDNCLGYLVELNAYEKLVYLVGYDTIDKIEKGEIPFSTISETISQKYGDEKADEILETMSEWYEKYNDSWKGDEVSDLSIKLENLFLDCMKEDINRISNKEETEKYIKLYEHYKIKNLPQAIDASGNSITNNIFNISQVDNTLKNKMQEFGITEEIALDEEER